MNTLAKRCLAHGVQILPYQQKVVFVKYEKIKVPDEQLNMFSKEDLTKYVAALYLCSQEMAGDWTRGYALLEELGSKRRERKEGHRTFVSMEFVTEVES